MFIDTIGQKISKRLQRRLSVVFATMALLWCPQASAGIDLSGTVPRLWVAANGDLWFTLDSPSVPTYCLPGWFGFSMTIPRSDPNYVYYYGLLATAVAKAKPVYIANISVYNGTTACDITRTGYGVVLIQ